MKKSILVLAALAATLGLSACNDLSTPETTMASAYTALQKGKIADFRDTLTDAATTTLGSADSFAKLRTELAGLKVTMGPKHYMGGQRLSYWHETYVYQLDVNAMTAGAAKPSRLKTATVVCDWHRGRHGARIIRAHDPLDMDTDIPESQECRISDLN